MTGNIFCIIIIVISILFFIKTNQIIADKTNQILQIQSKINKAQEQLCEKRNTNKFLHNQIIQQQRIYKNLVEQSQQYQRSFYQQVKNKQESLEKIYKKLEEQYELGYINFVKILDTEYCKKQQQFQQERTEIEKNLIQLKNELSATAAAKAREEEKEKNLDFYKIQLTEKQKLDIEKLQKWKEDLYVPSLVSKVIWSTYIIKATNDLCNRITNGKTVCGIYKITSTISLKSYIGQSVNITERLKQHIKCGLGIDAPVTNKLYNLMQEEGIYNFTFEILQQCSRDKLNERESFWIQTFQSDKFGVNGTGGNKK